MMNMAQAGNKDSLYVARNIILTPDQAVCKDKAVTMLILTREQCDKSSF